MKVAPLDRRQFLRVLGASSLGCLPLPAIAEPPPETTRLRLVLDYSICLAPQYVAEELLRLEGFTQIDYVNDNDADPSSLLYEGKADLTMDAATAIIPSIDAGKPIVVLAGIHGGCWELFGNAEVRSLRDLKNKRISITMFGSPEHVYIASMLAYVGMDPRRDVTWIEAKSAAQMVNLFVEGKADVFLGFPPQPQQVRAKKVGHVIVNTTQDRPWSQYFCCMVAGQRDFVRKNPIATKRALRAIVKATDICARDPDRAARFMVQRGYEKNYDIALEVVKEVSYNAWRTFDPDDTLRFYVLRLHEAGLIKSTPQKFLAQGADWRFINELKRELRA
jgi:NitT/TauT family transport system substrate-binding protein